MRIEQFVSGEAVDRLSDVLFLVASDGTVLDANEAAAECYGYSQAEMLTLNIRDIRAVHDQGDIEDQMREAFDKGVLFEAEHRRGDGSTFPVEIRSARVELDGEVALFSVIRDITDRKRGELFRDVIAEVLQSLNEPGNLHDSIQRIISVLKDRFGFDAVGIRLQDGEDYPYFAEEGFSDPFLLTENSLVEHDDHGGVCRDQHGNVKLDCTCGLVISGTADLSSSLFTRGGSFWTNDSFPLLDLSPEDDPRSHPRNQCMHHGYASMALVPIRNKDRIVGLIHINDRHKGRFSAETLQSLEGIASHIGSAMMRRRAEEDLERSQASLRLQYDELESKNAELARLSALKNQFLGMAAHDLRNPCI